MTGREIIEASREPSIIVSPASAYPFDNEDWADLVRELIRQNDLMADRVEIRLGYLYGDAWPPGWTWVTFTLDEATSAAIGTIAASITVWARNWIKKARQRDPNTAPIKATIYGPNGEILSEVDIPPEDSTFSA